MKPRIALALSGGGFRASIFHLGVLKRVAELGWLTRLDVISSVSGGSIVGAFLAIHWEGFQRAGGDDVAFDNVILRPFLHTVSCRNFLTQWLSKAWHWPIRKIGDRSFTRTTSAAELFDQWFFDEKDCRDLPIAPFLILNATSLQSIRSWRFTREGLGDSRVGYASWGDHPLSIGTCVGASAAFPPVFPPARIRRTDYRFSGPVYREDPLPELPLIPLTDGGAYDNSGLEILLKSVELPEVGRVEPADFLIVSDGGALPSYRFTNSGLPLMTEALLLYRVDEIAREQVSALRTRALMKDFFSRNSQGVLVSLRSEVARMGQEQLSHYCEFIDPDCLIPSDLLVMLRRIRTSLDRFTELETTALMYHAYIMTDAFLWCYRDTFTPEYRVASSCRPKWLIKFSHETVREWSSGLAESASVWKLR